MGILHSPSLKPQVSSFQPQSSPIQLYLFSRVSLKKRAVPDFQSHECPEPEFFVAAAIRVISQEMGDDFAVEIAADE